MTLLSLDIEFTGLHQKTTLISLALYNPDGQSFYAELTDYDPLQVDEWLQTNVIDNLILPNKKPEGDVLTVLGDYKAVAKALTKYLTQFENIRILGDLATYDWVLLCELFGGALNLPDNVYYIPIELCTLLETAGIDPDVSREDFSGLSGAKHNALDDAKAAYLCGVKAGLRDLL
jgi:hypothetical protein